MDAQSFDQIVAGSLGSSVIFVRRRDVRQRCRQGGDDVEGKAVDREHISFQKERKHFSSNGNRQGGVGAKLTKIRRDNHDT